MKIAKRRMTGVGLPVSELIIGCDNKQTIEEGAPVWDAWMEHGGNAFDTAYIYGNGLPEQALGAWIRSRHLEDAVVVTVKGAHTPNCNPEAIGRELAVSLERLQLARAPIYIMHRDNPEVPVGEFVEALNAEIRAGRIGIYGGSNWSVARFEEARQYATSRGLQPPQILNNNLSLAVMEKPVWAGCVSSNNSETLAYLGTNGIIHFSWSSQARGYFLPESLRNRLPEDTRPETCFGSTANALRRERAEELAARLNVNANNVALAWVLRQPFPSFALVGPRTVEELETSLPALALKLAPEEISWLNLS